MSNLDTSAFLSTLDDGLERPSSPLSVQQGGGYSFLNSPPFGLEEPLPESSDDSNEFTKQADHTLADLSDADMDDSVAVVDEDVELTKQSDNPSLRSTDAYQWLNESNQPCNPSTDGNVSSVLPEATPLRPVRKSVQELYGQPSWWGDDTDDGYSYPNTSKATPLGGGSGEASQSARKKTPKPTHSEPHELAMTSPVTEDQPSVHQRPQAFVIDFEDGKAVVDKTATGLGNLSECVPARLRRGLDERERQKREREQQKEETRRQATEEAVAKPKPGRITQLSSNSRGRRIVSNANASRETGPRPTPQSKAASFGRGLGRGASSTATTPFRPTTKSYAPRCATSSNVDVINAARRVAVAATAASTSARPSTARGSVSMTPSLTGAPVATPHRLTRGPSTRSAGPGSLIDRKVAPTGTTGHTIGSRRPSETTYTSTTTSRQSVPVANLRGTANVKASTPSTNLGKGSGVQQRPAASSKTPIWNCGTRGRTTVTSNATTRQNGPKPTFMSATTSSGAKRVNLTGTPSIQSIQKSLTSNSAKKPVTTTQLRRPATSSHPINRGLPQTSREHPQQQQTNRCQSASNSQNRFSKEATEVMAAFDTYEDPKAYLFYRMFQGCADSPATHDNTTDDVFKSFSSRSPSLSKRRGSCQEKGDTSPGSPQYDATLPQSDVKGTDEKEFVSNITVEVLDPSSEEPTQPLRSRSSKHDNPVESPSRKSQTPTIPVIKSSQLNSANGESKVLENKSSLSTSMLVSTSVTSLNESHAGTYILDSSEAWSSRAAEATNDMQRVDVEHKRRPSGTELESITPRGSQCDLSMAAVEAWTNEMTNLSELPKSSQHTPQKSTAQIINRLSHSVEVSQLSLPTQGSSLESIPVTRTSGRLHLSHRIPRQSATRLRKYPHSNSTSAWVETCQDDSGLDRTEAPEDLSASCSFNTSAMGNMLDTSALVSASVTSLAPSCSRTYVIDMDDTLAAQGILPAVIGESREDLLVSPTDMKQFRPNLALNAETPRGSPPHQLARDILWDVLEAEEYAEEIMLLRSSLTAAPDADVDQGLLIKHAEPLEQASGEMLFGRRKVSGNLVDEEDMYKSLPMPNRTNATEMDGRAPRNAVSLQNDTLTHSDGLGRGVDARSSGSHVTRQVSRTNNTMMPASDESNASTAALSRLTTMPVDDLSRGPLSSTKDPTHFTSDSLTRSNTVALSRPDRSPSSLSYCTSRPPSTTASVSAEHVAPIKSSTPPGHSANSRTETFAPLTDLHHCYRALQQSVNYLIQSQTEPLEPFAQTENLQLNLARSMMQESTRGAVSSLQPGVDVLRPTVGAAVWPSDALVDGVADGLRHDVLSRARQDRKHRSTTSLDSAWQYIDEPVTGPTHSSHRYRRSMITAINRRAFLANRSHENSLRHSIDTSHPDESMMPNRPIVDVPNALNSTAQPNHLHANYTNVSNTGATNVRSRSFRQSGSASVPEPGSPTHSNSSQSTGAGRLNALAMATGSVARQQAHLQSNYPHMLSDGGRLKKGLTGGPYDNPQRQMQPYATFDTNDLGVSPLEIDSRTFTRRKQTLDPQLPNFNSHTYQEWMASISAISEGIESLSKTTLFQSVENSRLANAATGGSCSDMGDHIVTALPDSTTGPAVRSAFVTPVPRIAGRRIPSTHSLTQHTVDSGMKLSSDLSTESKTELDDSKASSTYYALMVDSIRQLSLRLRQCSEQLVDRVNSEQSVSRTDQKGDWVSRSSSNDSVPAPTRHALSDALENMRTIHDQLKVVDHMLFAAGPSNENNESQYQSAKSKDPYRFIPIESTMEMTGDGDTGALPLQFEAQQQKQQQPLLPREVMSSQPNPPAPLNRNKPAALTQVGVGSYFDKTYRSPKQRLNRVSLPIECTLPYRDPSEDDDNEYY